MGKTIPNPLSLLRRQFTNSPASRVGLEQFCIIQYLDDNFVTITKKPPGADVGHKFKASSNGSAQKFDCKICYVGDRASCQKNLPAIRAQVAAKEERHVAPVTHHQSVPQVATVTEALEEVNRRSMVSGGLAADVDLQFLIGTAIPGAQVIHIVAEDDARVELSMEESLLNDVGLLSEKDVNPVMVDPYENVEVEENDVASVDPSDLHGQKSITKRKKSVTKSKKPAVIKLEDSIQQVFAYFKTDDPLCPEVHKGLAAERMIKLLGYDLANLTMNTLYSKENAVFGVRSYPMVSEMIFARQVVGKDFGKPPPQTSQAQVESSEENDSDPEYLPDEGKDFGKPPPQASQAQVESKEENDSDTEFLPDEGKDYGKPTSQASQVQAESSEENDSDPEYLPDQAEAESDSDNMDEEDPIAETDIPSPEDTSTQNPIDDYPDQINKSFRMSKMKRKMPDEDEAESDEDYQEARKVATTGKSRTLSMAHKAKAAHGPYLRVLLRNIQKKQGPTTAKLPRTCLRDVASLEDDETLQEEPTTETVTAPHALSRNPVQNDPDWNSNSSVRNTAQKENKEFDYAAEFAQYPDEFAHHVFVQRKSPYEYTGEVFVMNIVVAQFIREREPRTYCLYCGNLFRRIPVHMRQKHMDRIEVQDAEKSKDAKVKLKKYELLMSVGNYYRNNAKAYATQKGLLLPSRRCTHPRDIENLIFCSFCKALFERGNFVRHRDTCPWKDMMPKEGLLFHEKLKQTSLILPEDREQLIKYVEKLLSTMQKEDRICFCKEDPNVLEFLLSVTLKRLRSEAAGRSLRNDANNICRFIMPLMEKLGVRSTSELLVEKHRQAIFDELVEYGGLAKFMKDPDAFVYAYENDEPGRAQGQSTRSINPCIKFLTGLARLSAIKEHGEESTQAKAHTALLKQMFTKETWDNQLFNALTRQRQLAEETKKKKKASKSWFWRTPTTADTGQRAGASTPDESSEISSADEEEEVDSDCSDEPSRDRMRAERLKAEQAAASRRPKGAPGPGSSSCQPPASIRGSSERIRARKERHQHK